MITKAIEVRDRATFIPALAVLMVPRPPAHLGFPTPDLAEIHAAERFLLQRAGYNVDFPEPLVMLIRMEAQGNAREAAFDPYDWGVGTMCSAHIWIQKNWSTIKSGDVVDVEFVTGATKAPKQSERITTKYLEL